ncbi:hypothetical protein TrVGV298_006322 [Trichoderma virens]|nr:hypothetical protein TrVGV298_006322 [Trichoderma virens]
MHFTRLILMAGMAFAELSRGINLIEHGATIASPGGIQDFIITRDNTLNGTYHHRVALTKSSNALTLPVKLVNQFDDGQINAYIQGLDKNGAIVFVTADGGLIYPSSGGSRVPVEVRQDLAIPLPALHESITINIPIPLNSGRIYFCQGNLTFAILDRGNGEALVQPSINPGDSNASLNWGDGSIYANISYVDFVGLVLSMVLTTTNRGGTQITRGLHADAVSRLCQGLRAQSLKDDHHWLGMCVTNESGRPIRIISPNYYHRIHEEAFKYYWTGYVDEVWEHYSRTPLIIDTQSESGNVTCQVTGDVLRCGNDPFTYSKPSAADIWGCNSGPFARHEDETGIHLAVIPRLCAGFVRSTLLLEGGHVQPSLNSNYHYTVSPTHHYSRLVHELQIDGRGYAFSYDDVNPRGDENASGTVAAPNPDLLTIYVGSPPTDV